MTEYRDHRDYRVLNGRGEPVIVTGYLEWALESRDRHIRDNPEQGPFRIEQRHPGEWEPVPEPEEYVVVTGSGVVVGARLFTLEDAKRERRWKSDGRWIGQVVPVDRSRIV